MPPKQRLLFYAFFPPIVNTKSCKIYAFFCNFVHCCAKENAPAEGVLRKDLSARPSEIFPDGKVKYFLTEM